MITYTSYEMADAITHGGNFHADDIFSISCMEYLYDDDLKLCRLRLEDEATAVPLKHQIWFDIGGGEFDHHQKGRNGYHELIFAKKDPIPYASFGLLWNKFGKNIIRKYFSGDNEEDFIEYVHKYVDFHLVRGVDASDNGIFVVKPYISGDGKSLNIRVLTISCIISLLNPKQDENLIDADNEGLKQAICFARNALFTCMNKAKRDYLQGIYFEHITKTIFPQYRHLVYEAVKEYFGISTLRIPQKTGFTENEVYDYWTAIKEKYLNKFGTEWRSADNIMSTIINGICVDIEDIKCFARTHLDKVKFSSLSDAFGQKDVYAGENYEQDLKALVKIILEKIEESATYRIDSYEIVKSCIMAQKGHILVLPDRLYWNDAINSVPEAAKYWFVVNQTLSGKWKVTPIKSHKTRNGFRKGFPKAWLGLRRSELEEKRKIKGVYFIHDSGIIALCDDKESAIQLCKKAYGNTENLR